jgi:hypothetical protein
VIIRSDLHRSSGFDSLATRRSPVKRMRVSIHEKPEEHLGSHGSLYQLLLADDAQPLDLLQLGWNGAVRNWMNATTATPVLA